MTFKVSEDEARRIRALARKQKLSLSDLIRRKTLAADSAPGRIQRVKCATTGALIFSGPPDAAPLTTAAVREMLADFP